MTFFLFFLPSLPPPYRAAPILFTIFSLTQGKVPYLHLRNPVAGAAGIASGVIWNIGNVLQIASIPRITYAVAYSIYQVGKSWIICIDSLSSSSSSRAFFRDCHRCCALQTQGALFFSGLWGIVLFKEIKGLNAITNFFISAIILFGGQVLLAISVKQNS